MLIKHNKEELEQDVDVITSEPITAVWDGKEYNLSPHDAVTVKKGIVIHWEGAHPSVTFDTAPVLLGTIPSKEVVNPLEENDRGEAFSGLKRIKKKEG